jgi:hypothetical protein
MSGEDFLSRWSRRKHAAKTGVKEESQAPATGVAPPAASPVQAEPQPAPPLPPVESLTPESDFTPFMRSEVDPGLRRQALRTLFRDPRFNVMDGLDVYIDDYSKPDPIPPDWLGKLNQMARLGDYRPPEDAAKESDELPHDGASAEKAPEEQRVADEASKPESDTSAAGSPPSELKES